MALTRLKERLVISKICWHVPKNIFHILNVIIVVHHSNNVLYVGCILTGGK